MMPKKPTIASLQPVVLPDNRRVTMELVVENLPDTFANIMFMPDKFDQPLDKPTRPDPNTPSPYPNLELSILDGHRQQIATLFIVEHKEQHLSQTMHLREPDAQEQYIARAEMIYQDEIIDVIETPFGLYQADNE
jgi:hypothetical protein